MQEYQARQGLTSGITRRPVLNISDVVIALLVFWETGCWDKALDAAIPNRKKQPPTDNKPKKTRVRKFGEGGAPPTLAAVADGRQSAG